MGAVAVMPRHQRCVLTRASAPVLATGGKPPSRFTDFTVEMKYDDQLLCTSQEEATRTSVADAGGAMVLVRDTVLAIA